MNSLKPKVFTIVELITNTDIFPEIISLGFEQRNAIYHALKSMADYSGFSLSGTYPSQLRREAARGLKTSYYAAKGYKLPANMSIDDFAEMQGWEYGVTLLFNGTNYAFPPDYSEFTIGDSFTAKEITGFEEWEDVQQYLERKAPALPPISDELTSRSGGKTAKIHNYNNISL